MEDPQRDIPPSRTALYTAGTAVMAAGLALFFSGFFLFIASIGNFDDFEDHARLVAFCWFGGMVVMILGQWLRTVGARGWAGSGMVLDPQRARRDVEPWSRMAGGVIGDALSEINQGYEAKERPERAVTPAKVRCPKCHALNDQSAKFCNQCAAPL